MKKIEAIIREEKLESVRDALVELGYYGMTVTEVSGRGKQGGVILQWRVEDYEVHFLPKLKLELVVLDEDVYPIMNAIIKGARTGEKGDGKIFVLPVEDAASIRTGKFGIDAI